jgi:hypothetical protein
MTDEAFLCHACTGRLTATLRSCGALLTELDVTVARLDRHGPGNGSRSAEKPLPVNLTASARLADLAASLHGWARCLAEDTAATPSEPVHEWLANNTASIRLRDWAPDAEAEITRRATAAWRVIDRPPDTRCAGNCPCGQPLRAVEGQAVITCRECGAHTDVAEARDAMLARSDDRQLPAATIARALSQDGAPVTPSMIRGWVHWDASHGGGLASCAVDRAGRPLYRLGDVRARLAKARSAGIAIGIQVRAS